MGSKIIYTLRNSTTSAYAVTGCAGKTADAGAVVTIIDKLNHRTQDDVYVWTQKEGTAASSTGTIYGIYDLSGGVWERTAAIVNNGNGNLSTYGSSLLSALENGKSSKYVTVYPHDPDKDNTSISNAENHNYDKNTKIYGDAIRETSTEGIEQTSWYSDSSYFTGLTTPFSLRGGSYGSTAKDGMFSFFRNKGNSNYTNGLRAVLVAK